MSEKKNPDLEIILPNFPSNFVLNWFRSVAFIISIGANIQSVLIITALVKSVKFMDY